MNISDLTKNLQNLDENFPPVHLWNPPICQNQRIDIDANGDWFYNKSPIKNKKLVNLFSRVLKFENGNYFLVTPVEKVEVYPKIAPYLLVDFFKVENKFQLVTNTGYKFFLDKNTTTNLFKYKDTLIPIINVRSNIGGFFSRAVYYNIIEFALEQNTKDNTFLYLESDNIKHIVGKIA
jgi:hypothetical protein